MTDPFTFAPIDAKLKRAHSLVGFSNDGARPNNDWYPTPPEATEALLRVEQFDGSILEPACGDGAISTILLERGYDVISTDLIYRNFGESMSLDYTADDYPYRAANVITNPPFTLSEQFIQLSLERCTKKVAILGKLQLLEGQRRKLLFETSPFKKVWVFSKRITMARNGDYHKYSSSMIAFAWYVWQHGYAGSPTIGWL